MSSREEMIQKLVDEHDISTEEAEIIVNAAVSKYTKDNPEAKGLDVYEVKSSGGINYYVEGIGAVGGTLDEGGDLILPSAIQKSLDRGDLTSDEYDNMFVMHDNEKIPVGKIVDRKVIDGETPWAKNLWYKGRLNKDLENFKEVWKSIDGGYLDGNSIGYKTIESYDVELPGVGKIRVLTDIKMFEISPTPEPMNVDAKMLKAYTGKSMSKARVNLEQSAGVQDVGWMQKGRTYLKPGQSPPEGVGVQTGPDGGRYYISGAGKKPGGEKPPAKKPSREKPSPKEPAVTGGNFAGEVRDALSYVVDEQGIDMIDQVVGSSNNVSRAMDILDAQGELSPKKLDEIEMILSKAKRAQQISFGEKSVKSDSFSHQPSNEMFGNAVNNLKRCGATKPKRVAKWLFSRGTDSLRKSFGKSGVPPDHVVTAAKNLYKKYNEVKSMGEDWEETSTPDSTMGEDEKPVAGADKPLPPVPPKEEQKGKKGKKESDETDSEDEEEERLANLEKSVKTLTEAFEKSLKAKKQDEEPEKPDEEKPKEEQEKRIKSLEREVKSLQAASDEIEEKRGLAKKGEGLEHKHKAPTDFNSAAELARKTGSYGEWDYKLGGTI